MKKADDLFGLAFNDYIAGKKDGKILVDINISETEELPVAYFFRDYDEMPEWEQQVLDECLGKVLDVGAGAGSHALYLQQKGLDVTAIDISAGGVEIMQQRGVRKVMEKDFFLMETSQKFDTLLFLMNGAGMAQTIDNLTALLQKAAELLSPGGSIYLESTDIIYMYEEEDGSAMIDLTGNYYGEIMYQLQYKNFAAEPFKWLFVDFDNLSDAAALAKLDCEVFYTGDNFNYVARLFHAGNHE
jgi:SAM-dependent methyltransferase